MGIKIVNLRKLGTYLSIIPALKETLFSQKVLKRLLTVRFQEQKALETVQLILSQKTTLLNKF